MATKRKAASALTAAEQTAYQDTIGQLIQTGACGSLVAIHGDMNHDQHGSMGPVGAERFLPWHRDFLLKLEVQLQTLNPNSFIPYWDWTQERAIPAWMGKRFPSHERVPSGNIVNTCPSCTRRSASLMADTSASPRRTGKVLSLGISHPSPGGSNSCDLAMKLICRGNSTPTKTGSIKL